MEEQKKQETDDKPFRRRIFREVVESAAELWAAGKGPEITPAYLRELAEAVRTVRDKF